MTRPRVLFVDHAASLGGAELYLFDVATAFRDQCEVAVFEEGPFTAKLRESGVCTRIVQASQGLSAVRRDSNLISLVTTLPAVARQSIQLAQLALDFDVLFANSQKALIVCALAGWRAGRPVIWNLHDMLTADHFSSINRRLAVAVANAFTERVIVNSEATRQSLVESGGRVETSTVYNGIDASAFAMDASDTRLKIRAQLGVHEDQPLVGVFSRLAPWKGQHILIDALADLSDVHAVFVGDALFGNDQIYADALREQCRSAGLHDRVHFVGFQNNVAQWMHAVDIVAHTSTSPEPFGRVVVEGMLAGRPVVAAAAGGVLEIIEDGKTGRLVAPGDSSELAEVLRALFECPSKRQSLARAGESHAREAFSREQMVDGIRSVIQEVTLEGTSTPKTAAPQSALPGP